MPHPALLNRADHSGAASALRRRRLGSPLARLARTPAFRKLQGGLPYNPALKGWGWGRAPKWAAVGSQVLSRRRPERESPSLARSGREAGSRGLRVPLSTHRSEGAGRVGCRPGNGSEGAAGSCPLRALPGVSRSACRSHCTLLSRGSLSLAGPTMLSLDFLDDVRRMNKRQVRLSVRCFWASLSLRRCPRPSDAVLGGSCGSVDPCVRT